MAKVRSMACLRAVLLATLATGVLGCEDTPSSPFDAGTLNGSEAGAQRGDAEAQDAEPPHDAATDGELDAGAPPDPHCGFRNGKLDLLFVVDNSGSMADEQRLLAEQLPNMIRGFASGDVNGDGQQDHPKANMHVGVISTDMGVHPGSNVTGCTRFGDDALLRSRTDCPPSPLGYLAYAPESGVEPVAFGEQVGCQTQLGISGCGMEQQLEAVLKALTKSSSPLRFSMGTLGHGDGPNAGFLRDDSVLAIVIVTDEDDCSFPETSVGLADSSRSGPYADAGLNYRCQAYPDALYPVSRYIEGLRALRPEAPESVVLAIIAGVPPDLARGEHSIAEMLEDPRMQFRPDGPILGDLTQAVPACVLQRGTDTVSAVPARRLLQVAQAFESRAIIASICEETFVQPMEAIAKLIGGVLACPSDPVVF